MKVGRKKGYSVSETTRNKISKNNAKFWLGKQFSKKHRKKIGEALKKRVITKEFREKMSRLNKGRHHSDKTRKIMSELHKGNKSYLWKGGITPKNKKIRVSIEYRLWREAVFARDNWTCQKTEQRGGKLVAHHIQNFADFPELRFAIDNGITLSKKAHKEFHKIYGVDNNNKGQLEEFLER